MIKSRSIFHQVKTDGPGEESDRNQERERGEVIGQDKHCNPIIAIKLFSIKNLLYMTEQGVKTTDYESFYHAIIFSQAQISS